MKDFVDNSLIFLTIVLAMVISFLMIFLMLIPYTIDELRCLAFDRRNMEKYSDWIKGFTEMFIN